MLDWNDFRYFLALQRSGTLAAAARELGVKHTTVGRRLAALEEALGAKLFTHSPERFVLTRAGSDIVSLAEELEKTIGAIERRVAGDDARVEGTVRLTTSETFSAFFMKRIADLRARHPKLVVDVLTANRSVDLSRSEADVAVRAAPVDDPNLIAKRLAVCGWSMYANEAYIGQRGSPASPEQLDGHDVLGFDDTLRLSPGAQWLAAHAQGAHHVLRGNSIVSVMNAALVGMGIAMLPCFLGDQERNLRRLTPRVLGTREVWLVVHPDMARVSRVRAVMDFLIEVMGEASGLWSGEQKLE
jgi:DNA-binding transcriptional LysR family regulator